MGALPNFCLTYKNMALFFFFEAVRVLCEIGQMS